MSERLPPIPTFRIETVFAIRSRLMDQIFDSQVGNMMVGTDFAELVNKSAALLEVAPPIVQRSLQHLAGRELKPSEAFDSAWRLAANRDRLLLDRTAGPWTHQHSDEWVPVEITGTRYTIKKRPGEKHGRSGLTVITTALSGTAAAMDLTQFWSFPKVEALWTELGLSRKPPYHRENHSEIFGMRFAALIEPKLSEHSPSYFHLTTSSTMKTRNRELIKKRRRIDFTCPFNYQHECWQCMKGARTCGAAIHLEDYTVSTCQGCGKSTAFDTDTRFVNDFCLSCQPLRSAGAALPMAPVTIGPPRHGPKGST